jgi:SAM-dependent methyltransferase
VRAAEEMAERLAAMDKRFPLALDLGCRTGIFRRVLEKSPGLAARIGRLIEADLAPALLPPAAPLGVIADEEALPFAGGTFALVVSALALHATNDLPRALVEIRRALAPGGVFLAAMFGEGTLAELRHALAEAESDIAGGLSPRIAPFATLADAGNLLQRAGFERPVADVEHLRVRYADAHALMGELRAMGETNALVERARKPSPRALFARAAAVYKERFGDNDGRIPATFDIIYLTGWAPA